MLRRARLAPRTVTPSGLNGTQERTRSQCVLSGGTDYIVIAVFDLYRAARCIRQGILALEDGMTFGAKYDILATG